MQNWWRAANHECGERHSCRLLLTDARAHAITSEALITVLLSLLTNGLHMILFSPLWLLTSIFAIDSFWKIKLKCLYTKLKTTLSNGYLGSRNDEERSEMRYVMRIAEFSESSNLWTQIALLGSPGSTPLSVSVQPHLNSVCFMNNALCNRIMRVSVRQSSWVSLKYSVSSLNS